MKQIQAISARITLVILSFFVTVLAFAQEKGAEIDVNINKDGGGSTWYTQWWVWVVGAAIFILLLVALLRGNSARD